MRAKNLALTALILGMTNVMRMGDQRQVYVAPGHGKVFPKVEKKNPIKAKSRWGNTEKQPLSDKQLAKRKKRYTAYLMCRGHQYKSHPNYLQVGK